MTCNFVHKMRKAGCFLIMRLIESEIKEISVKLVNMHGDQLLKLKPTSVNIGIYLSPPSKKMYLPFSFSLFQPTWVFKRAVSNVDSALISNLNFS